MIVGASAAAAPAAEVVPGETTIELVRTRLDGPASFVQHPPARDSDVDICHTVLATVGGWTAPSIPRLHATHARLVGQLSRAHGRDTGTIDEAGNPIYVARHHPTAPKRRPRRQRFSP
jgi:hypothetical protein